VLWFGHDVGRDDNDQRATCVQRSNHRADDGSSVDGARHDCSTANGASSVGG
jgi:hypothetical protein